MNKLQVEAIEPEGIKPRAGDVVQSISYPEYFFFVSGRGDCWRDDKESRHTSNAQIIDGKFEIRNGWGADENFKILMRDGQPFEYADKSGGYTAEIDGVKYKLVKE